MCSLCSLFTVCSVVNFHLIYMYVSTQDQNILIFYLPQKRFSSFYIAPAVSLIRPNMSSIEQITQLAKRLNFFVLPSDKFKPNFRPSVTGCGGFFAQAWREHRGLSR